MKYAITKLSINELTLADRGESVYMKFVKIRLADG